MALKSYAAAKLCGLIPGENTEMNWKFGGDTISTQL